MKKTDFGFMLLMKVKEGGSFYMKELWEITKNLHRAKEYFENECAYNIGVFALKDKIENDLKSFNLIDVRSYDDYIDGHIPFASHVPLEKIYDNFDKFTKDIPNIIYSSSPACLKALKCAFMAVDKGYPCMLLKGGFKAWKKSGFDVIKDD